MAHQGGAMAEMPTVAAGPGEETTHVHLSLQGPARQSLRSGPRTRGGAGSGPTAHGAARDGAEPRAPTHAARALPLGVPVLA